MTFSKERLEELISINEAAERGIETLRKPVWASDTDYLKIDIIEVDGVKKAGPWIHLYSDMNDEINGRNPVSTIGFMEGDYNEKCWNIHTLSQPQREG